MPAILTKLAVIVSAPLIVAVVDDDVVLAIDIGDIIEVDHLRKS
jgi:hypothetical protein